MSAFGTLNWIVDHPLSKGRRIRNLAGFAAWQVRSRIDSSPRTFELANSAKMLAVSGMTGATGNLYVGLHEFQEMAFLLHLLRPRDLFADVGANVGSYTILAGAGAAARVVAFEPDGAAFGWLKRNIAINNLTNVEARQEAVGASIGQARFSSGLDTLNRIDPDGPAIVPMTTLDSIGGDEPTLIKIDVEGFELGVLQGAENALESTKAVIMELNDEQAAGFLEARGFKPYAYDPFKRRLAPLVEQSSNGLFIKDLDDVAARVQDAEPFHVRGWTI